MSTIKSSKIASPSSKKPGVIHIKGARSNNLQELEIKIPKEKLVVVTGLSGSGKSSLVMDTLYAEGQRRYVESLSSYARQFLVRMKKPDVDFIKGLCPAIAVEQRTTTANARSTVGSMTEIYDYLRLLFARIGKTYSPISGKEVKRDSVSDVVDYIMGLSVGSRVFLYVPISLKYKERSFGKELNLLLQKGFTRVLYDGSLIRVEDLLESKDKALKKTLDKLEKDKVYVLVDRFVVNHDEENVKRVGDSVQVAFFESEGECIVQEEGKKMRMFNNRFELDGMTFLEPSHQLFNYNNSYGACPTCEGYGRVMGIDEQKVFPRPNLSVYDGGVACWNGEKNGRWKEKLLAAAHNFDFPVHQPIKQLSKEEKKLLWTGNSFFKGIHAFFEELESKSYKIQNRVMLARYRGRTTCHSCEGGRLRKEAEYVKIDGHAITDWINTPIDELKENIGQLNLSTADKEIANRILLEINLRLKTLLDVGLSYLTLDRLSASLSGGESQRIHLTRLLGSNLTNSMYILDEPSIGLHPRDTLRLLDVLRSLRDLKNTVVVVEHEEEIIRGADHIIDIGPKAGVHGGKLIFSGTVQALSKKGKGLTAQYLNGDKEVAVRKIPRKVSSKIIIKGAAEHNLQNIDVTIPLNVLTMVTGVSGSGKSTLIRDILYRGLKKHMGEPLSQKPGQFDTLEGDLNAIDQIEFVSQSPIGKSSRSNPVTYVKAYDAIRKLFSNQHLSKIRGYEAKHFSFNVDGGRCDTCKGDGEVVVEMQFLADVRLLCDECKGARFKREILDVKYNGRNIAEILDLTIEEAVSFFEDRKDIYTRIKPLNDVGLGYVKLGQSSSTLSGGEAQRVKLASFLNRDTSKERIMFIFDEPTTGLHFDDVNKLLYAMNALVENGHTVVVIEHNQDMIKNGDWIIDLGPEGGIGGGQLVFEGKPEDLINQKGSYTGKFLKEKFNR